MVGKFLCDLPLIVLYAFIYCKIGFFPLLLLLCVAASP